MDDLLLRAIYRALCEENLLQLFMDKDASVPKTLNNQSDEVWKRAVARAFLQCEGPYLLLDDLFYFLSRVNAMDLHPFGTVFAAAIDTIAGKEGWAAVLTRMSGGAAADVDNLFSQWNSASASTEALALLKTALGSELGHSVDASAADASQ